MIVEVAMALELEAIVIGLLAVASAYSVQLTIVEELASFIALTFVSVE